MKPFISLALTLVLIAAALVGCGCTNQNMDNTSAPTVLPTNEEIWNSTETTTSITTDESMTTETTNEGTNNGGNSGTNGGSNSGTNGGSNSGSNNGTNGGANGDFNESTATESTETSRSINETEVRNYVNAHTDMMDKIREKEKSATTPKGNSENKTSRMMPGTR